ncbi:Alpha-1,4-glucan:maltose-1-phosphate maltosyltransferase, partial [Aduncisulcus paluster]
AVVGEVVPVAATVWREGHDAVAATLVVRCLGPSYPQLAEGPLRRISAPRDKDKTATRIKPVHIPMHAGGALDRFHASFVPDREGLWTFRLEAGQGATELANDLEIGARLFERAAAGVPRKRRQPLLDSADALRTPDDPGARFQHALSGEALDLLDEFPLRDLLTRGTQYGIWVDRTRALYGSWYELFPRSTGGVGPDGRPMHGTLATAAADLARVADMGFDVVYLPPIHPIGEINRKGRNNNPVADPGEVGSPWAIGSTAGGHDAIHPELGNLKDFDRFVATAHKLG